MPMTSFVAYRQQDIVNTMIYVCGLILYLTVRSCAFCAHAGAALRHYFVQYLLLRINEAPSFCLFCLS